MQQSNLPTSADNLYSSNSGLSKLSLPPHLIRERDIGRPKCQVACEAVLNINPSMKVEPKKVRIGSSEDKMWKYDEFWEEYDVVFCAVDNPTTRQNIDRKCVLYQKPMLECEMNGTEASTQIIIPFESQTYEESNDCFEFTSTPHYKLMYFPSTMKDCVIWVQDLIEKEFCLATQSFLSFQESPQAFIQLMKKEASRYQECFPNELKALEKIIQAPSHMTQEICLQYAAQIFDVNLIILMSFLMRFLGILLCLHKETFGSLSFRSQRIRWPAFLEQQKEVPSPSHF